jgi:hypothetical protein
LGWTAGVVERWNAFAGPRINGKPCGIRIDLFGCIDIVAVKPLAQITEGVLRSGIIGIQACALASKSARLNKAKAIPALRDWIEAGGRFQVWAWGKKGKRGEAKRWTATVTEVSLLDLPERQPSKGNLFA